MNPSKNVAKLKHVQTTAKNQNRVHEEINS